MKAHPNSFPRPGTRSTDNDLNLFHKKKRSLAGEENHICLLKDHRIVGFVELVVEHVMSVNLNFPYYGSM